MSSKTLDTKTETEVVAYIARGDKYDDIINVLKERGITISKPTITSIKNRNSQALKFMQDTMAEQEVSAATSILRKSRKLLEQKLDSALDYADELEALRLLLVNQDIDAEMYREMTYQLASSALSVGELNAITKESFNQSQVEQGKPSSITENPQQARANLQAVLNAIAAGDDEAAIKAIFLHD